jgi:hypothetical protein
VDAAPLKRSDSSSASSVNSGESLLASPPRKFSTANAGDPDVSETELSIDQEEILRSIRTPLKNPSDSTDSDESGVIEVWSDFKKKASLKTKSSGIFSDSSASGFTSPPSSPTAKKDLPDNSEGNWEDMLEDSPLCTPTPLQSKSPSSISHNVDPPKISLSLPAVDLSDAYDRAKGVKSNHPKPQIVHGSHVEHLWLHFPKGSLYADDEITVNFKDSFNTITDFLKAKYVKSTTAEQALLCPYLKPPSDKIRLRQVMSW